MRLLRAAPLQLGVTSLVLVAGMTLPGCVAEGQEGQACRDCAVNENVGARGVSPSAGLTGGTHASLFTSSDSWTVHERVDEVTIFFTATDRHKFVEGLNKEDIGVTDDGNTITKISAFGSAAKTYQNSVLASPPNDSAISCGGWTCSDNFSCASSSLISSGKRGASGTAPNSFSRKLTQRS